MHLNLGDFNPINQEGEVCTQLKKLGIFFHWQTTVHRSVTLGG